MRIRYLSLLVAPIVMLAGGCDSPAVDPVTGEVISYETVVQDGWQVELPSNAEMSAVGTIVEDGWARTNFVVNDDTYSIYTATKPEISADQLLLDTYGIVLDETNDETVNAPVNYKDGGEVGFYTHQAKDDSGEALIVMSDVEPKADWTEAFAVSLKRA